MVVRATFDSFTERKLFILFNDDLENKICGISSIEPILLYKDLSDIEKERFIEIAAITIEDG